MNSDEEWEEEAPSWKGVTGTVILINAYDPISSNVPGSAYKAACELVRHYMRRATSQLLGICIYGIETTNNNDEGFTQVFPLTVPTLDDIKALQDINIASYSQAKDFKLSTVLWHASKMFTNCKKLLAYKTVILLTRMDIPPINLDQKPALKRVVDLVDSGIEIKIVNISQTSYHSDGFYKNFLIEAHKGADFDEPQTVWELSDIMKSIQKYNHRHLAIASLNLQIDDDFSIAVRVYKLLQTHTKPKKLVADKETNQILTKFTTTTKVQYENNETESNGNELDGPSTSTKEVPLLKSELIFYQVFGDEKIEFSVDEMKKLKNPFGPPMLKLLGFKPASLLCKEKWYLKTCYFLYPNENYIEGSTIAFKALYQACKETSVIAICVMCTRVNASPMLVALRPCEHPLELDVRIGFDVIHIPFDENVRNVPKNEDCDKTPGEAHKVVLKDIINGLKFEYKPEVFENPNLQSLHRAIEALALDQEDLQPYLDTTKPDSNKLKTVDAQLFEEIFGRFGGTATKRSASTNPKEKIKKERIEGDDEIDESLLSSRLSMKKVDKYTVADLKKILFTKNIPNLPALTGLKKNQLVELVYDLLD